MALTNSIFPGVLGALGGGTLRFPFDFGGEVPCFFHFSGKESVKDLVGG